MIHQKPDPAGRFANQNFPAQTFCRGYSRNMRWLLYTLLYVTVNLNRLIGSESSDQKIKSQESPVSFFNKFNFKINKLSVKILENDSSSDDSSEDETETDQTVNLKFSEFFGASKDQSLIDFLKKGDVENVREFRRILRKKFSQLISTGCLADLLFFADNLLEYVFARHDLANSCNQNQSIDCNCSKKTQSMIDENSWTLDVLDSFGKFPAGFAKGNWWLLGDFEQCTGISVVKDKSKRIWQGLYSRADFFLYKDKLTTKLLDDDHMSLFAGIEGSQDMIHLPSSMPECNVFLHLKFGTCFPDTCSKVDVQTMVKYFINLSQKMLGKKFVCSSQVHHHNKLDIRQDYAAVILLIFLAVIFSLMVFGTCYDYNVHRKLGQRWNLNFFSLEQKISGNDTMTPCKEFENNLSTYDEAHPNLVKFILAFSVYTNGKKIFDTKPEKSAGHITCLHGIKALSMFWVLLAHTYSCGLLYVDNPMDVLAMPEKIFNYIILNASLAVDAFFVMSGLLLAYMWCKEMKKTNEKNIRNPVAWLMFYLHRYIRLTPLYGIVLAVDILLVKYLNDGPIWNINGIEPAICKQHWWSNLLYINNFVSTECMVWSWYLANDMQFFILSVPLLVLLWTYQTIGLILISGLIFGSSVIRGILIVSNDAFPPISVLFNNIDKLQIMEQFTRDVYVKPYCRCGPFLIGLLLGYAFYKTQFKIRIPKWWNLIGWISTSAMALGILFGIYNFSRTGHMPIVSKFIYGAFCRVFWSFFVAYVILACATGHGGQVNRFLSLNIWKPFSRLVFSAYLVHPILMLVNYSSLMQPMHYTSHYQIMLSYLFGYVVLTFFWAFWLTCAFEIPIQRLERLIFGKGRNYHKLKVGQNSKLQDFVQITKVSKEHGKSVEER